MNNTKDRMVKQIELWAFRNACGPPTIPDQQNNISLDLDVQIQGSQRTPNECVK